MLVQQIADLGSTAPLGWPYAVVLYLFSMVYTEPDSVIL
jgi:hypothetical protein